MQMHTLRGCIAMLFLVSALCSVASAQTGTQSPLADFDAALKTHDYPKAFKVASDLAATGSPEGAWALGYAYHYAYGTGIDGKKAMEWYKKSADAGYVRGMTAYADLLFGQNRDGLALAWIHKAADKGDGVALFVLGTVYSRGMAGLPVDQQRADQYFKAAFGALREEAERGFMPAQTYLGMMYDGGLGGLSQDPATARSWYEKAAAQGDHVADALLQQSSTPAQQPNTPAPQVVQAPSASGDRITTKDHSILTGTLKEAPLKFRSNYGTIDIATKDIVSFSDGLLTLADGTAMKGSFAEDKLPIDTARGSLQVATADVVRIERGAVPSGEAAKGPPKGISDDDLIVAMRRWFDANAHFTAFTGSVIECEKSMKIEQIVVADKHVDGDQVQAMMSYKVRVLGSFAASSVVADSCYGGVMPSTSMYDTRQYKPGDIVHTNKKATFVKWESGWRMQ